MRPGPVLGEKPPGLVPVLDGTKFDCPRREAKPQDIPYPQRCFLYRRTQEAPQGPLQFPIRGPAGQAFFPNSYITLPMDAELEKARHSVHFVPQESRINRGFACLKKLNIVAVLSTFLPKSKSSILLPKSIRAHGKQVVNIHGGLSKWS